LVELNCDILPRKQTRGSEIRMRYDLDIAKIKHYKSLAKIADTCNQEHIRLGL